LLIVTVFVPGESATAIPKSLYGLIYFKRYYLFFTGRMEYARLIYYHLRLVIFTNLGYFIEILNAYFV
jgi:hypothetical protein